MTVSEASNQQAWDTFLSKQQYSPFLQSWTMGEVYREIGHIPVRLEVREDNRITAICQAIVVPARRGRHLAVSYGPVMENVEWNLENVECGMWNVELLVKELRIIASENNCCFIRISPFWQKRSSPIPESIPAPLHMLAENLWVINLQGKSEDDILKGMRKNTRNLIRRAEREGVTVTTSKDPVKDIKTFLSLHEETRKRHGFTPYRDVFFKAQVQHFAPRNECTMYLAHYQGEVIASSIHMHAFGETSYHHGASTAAHAKIPASYLLQWTAIRDAIKRGDHLYNFWGIAPDGAKRHPFAGVRTFKTGFGGEVLELCHCMDVPISKKYYLTRTFELIRKWHRGF